jgi:hypothetical protein
LIFFAAIYVDLRIIKLPHHKKSTSKMAHNRNISVHPKFMAFF